MEGVSHLTPVRVRAEEEQQDDTMEIDIMNSDTPVKSVVEQREEDNQSKIGNKKKSLSMVFSIFERIFVHFYI